MTTGAAPTSSRPFPLVKRGAKGYRIDEVESFLALVKLTYEGEIPDSAAVSSGDIRRTSFSLGRNGYDPRYVDAALDRLEEVLFERERRSFVHAQGTEAWQTLVRDLQQELRGRFARAPKRKFRRRSFAAYGYHLGQVDAIMDQIAKRFTDGSSISTAEIRGVKFHVQLGGYSEAQVDAFLDSVIEYLLASR